MNDKLEGLMWDVQDMTTQKDSPETRKMDMAMDDLYVITAEAHENQANEH